MRSINLVVVHCSGSPNGVYVTPEQVDSWHRERGFHRDPEAAAKFNPDLPHIGYHVLVLADGTIAFGRAFDEVGAHAQGHNANSIGICMIGISAFFLSQWDGLSTALASCLRQIAFARGVDVDALDAATSPVELARRLSVHICGHRDLSPDLNGDGTIEPSEWLKTCPGFDVKTWLDGELEPLSGYVLDDHPAIATAAPPMRAMHSLGYGRG